MEGWSSWKDDAQGRYSSSQRFHHKALIVVDPASLRRMLDGCLNGPMLLDRDVSPNETLLLAAPRLLSREGRQLQRTRAIQKEQQVFPSFLLFIRPLFKIILIYLCLLRYSLAETDSSSSSSVCVSAILLEESDRRTDGWIDLILH